MATLPTLQLANSNGKIGITFWFNIFCGISFPTISLSIFSKFQLHCPHNICHVHAKVHTIIAHSHWQAAHHKKKHSFLIYINFNKNVSICRLSFSTLQMLYNTHDYGYLGMKRQKKDKTAQIWQSNQISDSHEKAMGYKQNGMEKQMKKRKLFCITSYPGH